MNVLDRCTIRRYGRCVGHLVIETNHGREVLVCDKCGAAHGTVKS